MLSSLYYGCAVWCDSNPKWLKKVQQFHYKALIKTLGVKCTPSAAETFRSCSWDMPTVYLHKDLVSTFCRVMYHKEGRDAYEFIQKRVRALLNDNQEHVMKLMPEGSSSLLCCNSDKYKKSGINKDKGPVVFA